MEASLQFTDRIARKVAEHMPVVAGDATLGSWPQCHLREGGEPCKNLYREENRPVLLAFKLAYKDEGYVPCGIHRIRLKSFLG